MEISNAVIMGGLNEVIYELSYKNKKLHGVIKHWRSRKRLSYKTTYKNDLQCGTRIEFEY